MRSVASGSGGIPATGTRPEGTTPAAGRAATEASIDAARERAKVIVKLTDERTGGPLGGARYELVGGDGTVVARGTTPTDGVVRHDVPASGRYRVRVLEVPAPRPATAAE